MKSFLQHLLAHIPTKLPQGISEFNTWASSIISLYGMPDNDSVRFALAVSIMHLPSTAAYKPKAYFGYTLIKGAASQVAGGVMQDLKEKQAAEQKAYQEAEAAKLAAASQTPVEDTTLAASASDVKTN